MLRVAAVCGWLLTTTLVVCGPATLAAQIPYTAADIPVVPGTSRDPHEETDFRGSDTTIHYLRAYRIGASIEQLYRYYLLRLDGQPEEESADTAPGGRLELAPIRHRVTFHTFEDWCTDPGSPAGPAAADCHKPLLGKDKRNAIDRVRIPVERDHWIDAASFTWYRREDDGSLTRLRVLIKDIGLAKDWKHYTPLGQLIIVSDTVQPPTKR